MNRAYFFDLDGTLIDTETLWVTTTRKYLTDVHAIALTEADAVGLVYGHSWNDIHQTLVTRYPALAPLSAEAMGDQMRPLFHALRTASDIAIPGSVECLRRLAHDHRVAVVSGSPREDVRNGIEMLGIGAVLAFYLGSEDYSPGKPSPNCYIAGARQLALPPEQCVVFEDSTVGMLAAKSAGMRCVALQRPNAPAQDTSPADLVLTDLSEFDPAWFWHN